MSHCVSQHWSAPASAPVARPASSTPTRAASSPASHGPPGALRWARISMDGRGRWMDNVFIERLWRSITYEEIYLREYATVAELEQGVGRWMKHYNTWRPH